MPSANGGLVGPAKRTLLLAPPSVASHPTAMTKVSEAYDRQSTDIQMLDRLSMGLASLPDATYDLVLLLTDADGSRAEGRQLLDRDILTKVALSLRPGGKLRSQDGTFGREDSQEKVEAILSGLVATETADGPAMMRPESSSSDAVPLKFAKRAKISTAKEANGTASSMPAATNGSATIKSTPAGVGFIDTADDLDALLEDIDDDELIDENELLTEEDKARPTMPPPECIPKTGKRRRACKDCSCGLAQRLEAEDRAKRAAADAKLKALHGTNGKADAGPATSGTGVPPSAMLAADDLNEVDFTVPGTKVGSCGNCALGDAFRCDGCPYIGLPAFKPGEEVRLLNNDVQL